MVYGRYVDKGLWLFAGKKEIEEKGGKVKPRVGTRTCTCNTILHGLKTRT